MLFLMDGFCLCGVLLFMVGHIFKMGFDETPHFMQQNKPKFEPDVLKFRIKLVRVASVN